MLFFGCCGIEEPKILKGRHPLLEIIFSSPKFTPLSQSTRRRVSGYAFLRGSLTVEASILVPLFLLTMYLFWGLFSGLMIHTKLQYAADEVTAELAERAYLMEALPGESGESDGGLSFDSGLSRAAWRTYAGLRLVQLTGREALKASPVKGGALGLNLADSEWDLTGNIRLVVRYKLRFPGLLGKVYSLPMEQVSLRKCWTGLQAAQDGGADTEDGEKVYVTEYGRVYHQDISCYHLKLTIREVSAGGVGSARSSNGSIYRPCEHCAVTARSSGILFITPDGNRYHVTRDCSGLKRSIKTVSRATCGLPPCSNCARE